MELLLSTQAPGENVSMLKVQQECLHFIRNIYMYTCPCSVMLRKKNMFQRSWLYECLNTQISVEMPCSNRRKIVLDGIALVVPLGQWQDIVLVSVKRKHEGLMEYYSIHVPG